MSMANRIKKISVSNYILRCDFSDGRIVDYDMADVLEETGPIAAPLKDSKFFEKVFLESGVPTWPNGYDVCPDEILLNGVEVKTHTAS